MFSRIRYNLFLCGFKDINKRVLKENNISYIVNLGEEESESFSDIGVLKANIRFKDSAEEAAKHAGNAVDYVKMLLNKGERVLVHCSKGASRSPHVVASVLSELEGVSYDEAYADVREKHPRAMEYSIGQEIRDKGLAQS